MKVQNDIEITLETVLSEPIVKKRVLRDMIMTRLMGQVLSRDDLLQLLSFMLDERAVVPRTDMAWLQQFVAPRDSARTDCKLVWVESRTACATNTHVIAWAYDVDLPDGYYAMVNSKHVKVKELHEYKHPDVSGFISNHCMNAFRVVEKFKHYPNETWMRGQPKTYVAFDGCYFNADFVSRINPTHCALNGISMHCKNGLRNAIVAKVRI